MSLNLVYVQWKDHHMRENWVEDVDDFHGPAPVQSVGWVVKEDDEGITLAQSVNAGENDPKDRPGNLLYVLKACIIRRDILKVT